MLLVLHVLATVAECRSCLQLFSHACQSVMSQINVETMACSTLVCGAAGSSSSPRAAPSTPKKPAYDSFFGQNKPAEPQGRAPASSSPRGGSSTATKPSGGGFFGTYEPTVSRTDQGMVLTLTPMQVFSFWMSHST